MPDPRDPHAVIVADPRAAQGSRDVADAIAEVVRAGFGVVALGLGVALRTMGEAPGPARQPGPRLPVADVADVVVGTAWGAARLSGRVATTGSRLAAPVLSVAFRPPLVPRRLQPGHGVALMVQRWQRDRPGTVRSLGHWSATALPGAVDAALSQVDVERLVAAVLDHVDLDRLVADVVRRLDIDALVAAVLGRLDVEAVASSALDQLDLTQLVLDRVDLERVVGEALEHLDLTQVVLQQVDLIGVAEYVVQGIDLPEIIRVSTGSVASEAVRGLRMQGVDADLAVARAVDRVLFRRRHRRTGAPSGTDTADAADADTFSGSRR